MPIYKGKKVNRFDFDKNRKTAAKRKKNKIKKKNTLSGKSSEEKILAKVWDERRSLKQNLESIGLSNDPNKTIKINKTRLLFSKLGFIIFIPFIVFLPTLIFRLGIASEPSESVPKRKESVILQLEDAAKDEAQKEWAVSQDDIHFCVNMLDKHGQVNAMGFAMWVL